MFNFSIKCMRFFLTYYIMVSIEKVNRCKICLEEKCGGDHTCNCSSCKNINKCYKVLHATIRITNKCTEECPHCCFSSSPKSNIMMSVEKAKDIALFLKNSEVISINLMGGEFFCNPDWYEIVNIFINSVHYIRIVSNGDWYPFKKIKDKLIELNKNYKNKFRISISNDRYHTNKYVKEAEEWLKDNNIDYNIGTTDDMKEDAIVPIGRSSFSYSLYSSFSCYCHNPIKQYSFLIDEEGKIYKCGFGVWQYADINDYKKGGFDKRFKEFNKRFYNIFIPSCASCIRCASKEKDNIVSHE